MPDRSSHSPMRGQRLLFVGGLVGFVLVVAVFAGLGAFDLELDGGPMARTMVVQFWNLSGWRGKSQGKPTLESLSRSVQGGDGMSVPGAQAMGAGQDWARSEESSVSLIWMNARAWDSKTDRSAGTVVVAAVAWDAMGMGDWVLHVQGDCGGARSRAVRVLGGNPAAALFELPVSCRPTRFELHDMARGAGAVTARQQVRGRFDGSAGSQSGIWPVTRQWSRALEWLYSVWIRTLFAEPRRTWRPLHQVVRDSGRNLLFGLLGLDEDSPDRAGGAVTMWADCADVPYLLRAYFAWKLGLAMRFRECSRGTVSGGPRCDRTWTNLVSDFDETTDPVARFNRFIREGIAWKVHSGTLRTLPEDSDSDAFPLAVRPDVVLPGTMYVDVAGHVLLVVEVGSKDLVAVDGHPDKTVTVKRFSRAKFFPYHRVLTGGLKAFRPLRYRNGRVDALPNRELWRRFSLEQYCFDSSAAYHGFVRSRLTLGQFHAAVNARL